MIRWPGWAGRRYHVGLTRHHEEATMKRKGHRTIPDFSKKHPSDPHAPPAKLKVAPPPTPLRAAKPQATSAKSGQRGR